MTDDQPIPDGWRVIELEDGEAVRIYNGERQIVSAKLVTLAAFYCWVSAERNALLHEVESLRQFKAAVDAALNSGDGSYRP